jgi:3-oxoacyl-[acyl-carrier protein] reductase
VDLSLSGKVALVTAASKGLGRAIATELAREGARVVISSHDDEALSRAAAKSGRRRAPRWTTAPPT